MGKKILANDGIDAIGQHMLEKAGFTVITTKVPQENLIEFINREEISALSVRSATKVRKDIIDACPHLRVIARGGVGMDNIDVEYARSKEIRVINTPASSSNSVAELVFAHLFTAVRFLYDSNRQMPVNGSDKFEELKKKYAKGIELRNKTIGIIGFGRIGQNVAKMAFGLGMRVVAYDPFVKEVNIQIDMNGVSNILEMTVHTSGMAELLNHSDFITVHVPGGELLGETEIAQMKKGAILVNTARGGVINEGALVAALNSGHLAHACLDVFQNEPKPFATILTHPKISLSPHIGAATNEAQERIGIELAEKLIEALK